MVKNKICEKVQARFPTCMHLCADTHTRPHAHTLSSPLLGCSLYFSFSLPQTTSWSFWCLCHDRYTDTGEVAFHFLMVRCRTGAQATNISHTTLTSHPQLVHKVDKQNEIRHYFASPTVSATEAYHCYDMEIKTDQYSVFLL